MPTAKSKSTATKRGPGKTSRVSAQRKGSAKRRASGRKTPAMRGETAKAKGLAELFLHGIQDIYYAENTLTKALPQMIKAARSEDLAQALKGHLTETQGHVKKVARIFGLIGQPVRAKRCEAIDGIVAEAQSIMKEFGSTAAGDAAIIFAGQAAEHYEITRYGSLRAFAEILKYAEAEKLIEGILAEEKAADDALTKIAEDRIDWAANVDTDDNPNGTHAAVKEDTHRWRLWS